jgi:hypothetical protein
MIMETVNLILLTLHNLTRWAVVAFGLLAIVRAFMGWLGKKPWRKADDQAGLWYNSLFDIQLLLGAILFFTKGWQASLLNFGQVAGISSVRFFAMEHWLMMLVALVLAHVGRVQSKKAKSDSGKHKRAALWFLASFVLLFAAIPWPFMAGYGRPLLRFFGLF